jgi:hypothetical protein
VQVRDNAHTRLASKALGTKRHVRARIWPIDVDRTVAAAHFAYLQQLVEGGGSLAMGAAGK